MDRTSEDVRVRHDHGRLPHSGSINDHSASQAEPITAEVPPDPQVLVRAIVAPPALPWDQSRAAKLEATLNAPLPLAEVGVQLRRIEPWHPGAQGRFAAIYARSADIARGFRTVVQLDGLDIAVQFLSPDAARAHLRRIGVAAVVATVSAFTVTLATVSVIATRLDAVQRLEVLDQNVNRRLAQARRAASAAAQARALTDLGVQDRAADQLLEDLAWVSEHRDPAVDVEAVHWEGGLIAVEVRGDGRPFINPDRAVQRSAKPVRPGVWLWGVTRNPPATSQEAAG